MFKKPPQVKPAANIKSSDRRKLLSAVCKTYNLPIDEIAKEGLDNLVPPISKKASFTSPVDKKLSGTIYFDSNEIPTWFQTRDSQLYPSLFTCWKCPYVLPLIKTHEPVIGILGKGADLMLPGTIPPFDERAVKHAVVGIVSKEKPNVIMAVGVCRLNLTQFDYVVGRSGMAVEIIHHFEDELMKLNKEIDVEIPEEVNAAIPKIAKEDDEVKTEEGKLEEADEDVKKEGQPKKEDPTKDSTSEHTPVAVSGETKTEIDDVAEELAQLTTEEVDNFFIRALLQTIKLETIELPINSSTFMSSYIYKNLPILDSTYANIKKTSWKKTSKFLKAMVKSSYLEVKGKDEDLSVIKLMARNNPTIENFVPHKVNKVKKPTSSGSNGSDGNTSSSSMMKITTLYKPTSKSRMFFNKLNVEFDHLYTMAELRTMFNDYVKLANLASPTNPKHIVIDEILSKPTNKLVDSESPRDQIFTTFLSNFTPHYSITSNQHSYLSKGTPPKIHIVTEMKIGRKVITRVGNYDKFFIKQGAFAEELRKLCSGSTTIVDDEQVQVQGPHGKTIIQLLKEKGVPLGCIEFEDKVKKKKRK
ncbi:hypothetical protein CANMA_001210 [Candida margitis]|uniref:uncharacterized protein n=1 Tax=Candida margitis TaxID=1775924 RepID=UPI0022268570|nr:uncharacterized protein CANMA_001210 [Candida margitis]KAI5969748.1 hypothetical protein CANMA_001210 [Candida margitis]